MNFLVEILSAFRFPQDALDIIIVAVVFYNLILLIRGTRAIQMLYVLLQSLKNSSLTRSLRADCNRPTPFLQKRYVNLRVVSWMPTRRPMYEHRLAVSSRTTYLLLCKMPVQPNDKHG